MASLAATGCLLVAVTNVSAEDRNLYWGDTHLHSSASLDAYAYGNRSIDADTSFRFAKGAPVRHPTEDVRIRLDRPLDFLVVSDHAEYAGVISRIFADDELIRQGENGRRLAEMAKDPAQARAVLWDLVASVNRLEPYEDLAGERVRATAWAESVAAADRHNEPGKFTALIGWEWSSLTNAANLHRVVFTSGNSETAGKFLPFSALDSDRPEDLWDWLDKVARSTGAEFVAIPHNSNISKGRMFPLTDSDGVALTVDYARSRSRWEPVAEVTQAKGDSESHPLLSPEDEYADFELYEHVLDTREGAETLATPTKGDYLRNALIRGLQFDATLGENPFKLGLIGSTDMHTGLSTPDETNFWGKYILDSTLGNKTVPTVPGATGWYASASGLAGVWAEQNTRESITAAFKRREVYATTGTRIKLRFFGGWNFRKRDLDRPDLAAIGYEAGVPMGGDLTPAGPGKALTFLVQAVKDPRSANLDRVQVVKGWVDAENRGHEKIYDVAWSGEREVGADGVLQAVGNTVDLTTATYTNSIGSPELVAVWTDPDFDASERAFYYLRVLEIPTPRHSLYDALALGVDPTETSRPGTIQERAYSSPIWYSP
jgi:hypothetical protein